MRMVGVAGGFELVGELLRLVRSAAPQRLPSAAHLIIGTAGVIPPESNPSSAAEQYGHPEESQQLICSAAQRARVLPAVPAVAREYPYDHCTWAERRIWEAFSAVLSSSSGWHPTWPSCFVPSGAR